MIKEELRKLRALSATPAMEKIADNQKYEYLFRIQCLGAYIKIAVFFASEIRKNIKTPKYEIYLNVEGREWITRCMDTEGKETGWSHAMLINLPGISLWSYRYKNKEIYCNKDGRETLAHLPLNTETQAMKGYQRLMRWQQEVWDEDTLRKEKAEQKPWDEDMALVPKLPKTFEEWMRKQAVEDVFIIYEYDKREQTQGYCSRCKKIVPISHPRHNTMTTCPHCKAEAQFKSSGKVKTLATGRYYAEIIQKIKGGVVIRTFRQSQSYGNRSYKDPWVYTHEFMRTLVFDDGSVRKYDYDKYKNKYQRWIRDDQYREERGFGTYYWSIRIKMYKRNWSSIRQTRIMKESAINLWSALPMQVSAYLAYEKGNPAVEKLARIGMFRLAKDMIKKQYDSKLLDEKQTELAKLLRIDGSRLKRLKDLDANYYMLKWMQYEKLANTVWPDAMIKDLGNANIGIEGFNFLLKPKIVKAYNYLKKQSTIMYASLEQTRITWRDYINMADQMKMNTGIDQIRRPKDLKLAHDELIRMVQQEDIEKEAKKIAKKWPKVNKTLPQIAKFEYTEGEYTIVAPKTVQDIVLEGRILRHCVHTCDYYFDRIGKHESYLFFLRHTKDPKMPWYTLEVEPSGNIRQKRTTGDNQNPDFEKAVPFLKHWQKYFQKQLTEQEKQFGDAANRARIEEYKNLRKNQNRIWHGKLAGKLLADVLEADFMQA